MTTGQEIAQSAKEISALNPQAGYIYGTSGQTWTANDQARITIEKADDPNYAYSIRYGGQWVGHKVYDCSGLTMRVYADHGVKLAHGSNSQHRACVKTGPVREAPVGALVFKVRGTDYHHVGIYVGDGDVVEAQGARTGVIVSRLESWHEYGLVNGVDYGTAPAPDIQTAVVGNVQSGKRQDVNLRSQPSTSSKVIARVPCGESVGVLSNDGTWSKVRWNGHTGYMMTRYLIFSGSGVPPDARYCVTIEGLTKEKADEIVGVYGGSITKEA